MGRYVWTRRVGAGGLGLLVLWAVFVAVVRVVNVPLGGIQPEAFTLGAVVLATLVTWGLEKMVRRRLVFLLKLVHKPMW